MDAPSSKAPSVLRLLAYLAATLLFVLFTWLFSLLSSVGFAMLQSRFDFLGLMRAPLTQEVAVPGSKLEILAAFEAANPKSALTEEEKMEKLRELEKTTKPSTLSQEEKLELLEQLSIKN